jgi:tight adherence protein C
MIRSRLGRRDDPAADARLGRAALAAVLVLPVVPLLAPAAGAATWAFGAWRGRQRRRAEADLIRRGLPEVVDLFVVGIGAGLNVPLALRAIGPLCPAPFADALRSTVTHTEMGMRTADALEALPQRLGEPVRPLSSALIASERYGVPLTASLERLADEVRRDRRRHAEAAARRVPVKLLFPLVFCSLPALALLSVAPLIAGALRALRT